MAQERSPAGGVAVRSPLSRPSSSSSSGGSEGSLTYEVGPGLVNTHPQGAAAGAPTINPLLQQQQHLTQSQQPFVSHPNSVLYPPTITNAAAAITSSNNLGSAVSATGGSGMASRRGQNSHRMHSVAAEPYCSAEGDIDSDLTAEELQLYREEQYWESVRLAQWQQHQYQQQQRRLAQQQQQQQQQQQSSLYSHYHDPTAGLYGGSKLRSRPGSQNMGPHLSPQRSVSGSFFKRYSTIKRCMLGLLVLGIVAVCVPCVLHVRSGHAQHVTHSAAGVTTHSHVTLAHIAGSLSDESGVIPADGSSSSSSSAKHSKWTLRSLWCKLSSSALTCLGAWSCSTGNTQAQVVQQPQSLLPQQQVAAAASHVRQGQAGHLHGAQPITAQQQAAQKTSQQGHQFSTQQQQGAAGSSAAAEQQQQHQLQQRSEGVGGDHTTPAGASPPTFATTPSGSPMTPPAEHPLANATRFLSLFYTSILPALLETPWSEVHHAGSDKALTAAAGLLVRLSAEPGYEGLTHVDMGEQGMGVGSSDAQISGVKQGPHKGFHALPSLTAAVQEFSKPLGSPLPPTPQLLELMLQGMWEAQASSCLGAAKSLPERRAPPQPFTILRSIVLRNQQIHARPQAAAPQGPPVHITPGGGVFNTLCARVKPNTSEVAPNDPRIQCFPCEKCDTQGLTEAEWQLVGGSRQTRGHVDAAWNVTATRALSNSNGPASPSQAMEHVSAVDLERTAFPVTRRVLVATLHLVSTALQQQVVQRGVPSSTGTKAAVPAGGLLAADVGTSTAGTSAALASAAELLGAVEAAGREVVTAAQSAERCAAEQKPVTEMLHVSKSGGSSMCELARLAGKKSPFFNIKQNCMVPSFGDSPRWIVKAPSYMPPQCTTSASGWLVSQQKCPDWLAPHRTVTCRMRAAQTQRLGADFYMNEAFIHESQAGSPSAARTCGEFRSLVVLREPMARIASHVAHLRRLMETEMHDYCYLRILGKPLAASPEWSTPGDLQYWAGFAPEVMDNYVLRHLMGKHGRCMWDTSGPRSAFDATHYAHGLAKLVSFDNVMTLDDSVPNSEVIFKLGLGWGFTTQDVAFRINNASHHVEEDLGFPKGSLKALQDLNRWDRGLYRLGSQVAALDAAYLATAHALGLRAVAGQGGSVQLVRAPGSSISASTPPVASSTPSTLSASLSSAWASLSAAAAVGDDSGDTEAAAAAAAGAAHSHDHQEEKQGAEAGAAQGQVSGGPGTVAALATQRRHLMMTSQQAEQQSQQQQLLDDPGQSGGAASSSLLAQQRRGLKQQALKVTHNSMSGVRDFIRRTRSSQASATAVMIAARNSGKVLPRAAAVHMTSGGTTATTQVSSTHTPASAVQEPQEKDLSFIRRTEGNSTRRVLFVDERLVLFSAATQKSLLGSPPANAANTSGTSSRAAAAA